MNEHLASLAIKALRGWWRVRGGRRIQAFGHSCWFSADTEFPIRAAMRLPRKGWSTDIVRYGDAVQFHAAGRYLVESPHPAVVIDVGAHHGIYAVILGKLLADRGGTLLALEPNPEAYAVLKRNIQLNRLEGTVRCEPIAAWSEEGSLPLSIGNAESHLSLTARAGPMVEVSTLRSVIQRNGLQRVDLLLIDVEGAELAVLAGFPWECTPVGCVFCELHPYAWQGFGYGDRAFQAFLDEHGYRCVDAYLQEQRAPFGNAYIGPTHLLKTGESHHGT
jgi:FkbM family methyltransferase